MLYEVYIREKHKFQKQLDVFFCYSLYVHQIAPLLGKTDDVMSQKGYQLRSIFLQNSLKSTHYVFNMQSCIQMRIGRRQLPIFLKD